MRADMRSMHVPGDREGMSDFLPLLHSNDRAGTHRHSICKWEKSYSDHVIPGKEGNGWQKERAKARSR